MLVSLTLTLPLLVVIASRDNKSFNSTHIIELKNLSKELNHCKLSRAGLEYTGRLSYTMDGTLCSAWVNRTNTSTTVERNYCRNPDIDELGPWCYTFNQHSR